MSTENQEGDSDNNGNNQVEALAAELSKSNRTIQSLEREKRASFLDRMKRNKTMFQPYGDNTSPEESVEEVLSQEELQEVEAMSDWEMTVADGLNSELEGLSPRETYRKVLESRPAQIPKKRLKLTIEESISTEESL